MEVHGLLTAVASLVAKHRLQVHRLQQWQFTDLVVPRQVESSWTRNRTWSPALAGAFLSIVLPGKSCVLFFKHTAIEPLINYSIGQMQLVCALEKQKLRVTHFIVIFAILQWSGTEPPQ